MGDNKTNIAKEGGCGTVASANIIAYLAQHNLKYAGLYTYADYSKGNYILHMKDMYEYVTPRHIGSAPFGVWPISMLEDGVYSDNYTERNIQRAEIISDRYSFGTKNLKVGDSRAKVDYVCKWLTKIKDMLPNDIGIIEKNEGRDVWVYYEVGQDNSIVKVVLTNGI